jgi:hypothetical protein
MYPYSIIHPTTRSGKFSAIFKLLTRRYIMTFVCNAGPVIALAKIDRLSLLRDLAEAVLIPEIVLHEVLAKPGLDASRILTATRSFLSVRPPPEAVDPAVYFT